MIIEVDPLKVPLVEDNIKKQLWVESLYHALKNSDPKMLPPGVREIPDLPLLGAIGKRGEF